MTEVSRLVGEPGRGRDASWSPAPSPLSFPAGRVDVWRVNLEEAGQSESSSENLSPDLSSDLSSDESARARRFRFEKDRVHFARCRSALRGILGDYLRIAPAEIRFHYLPGGKPQLEAEQNPRGLQFNVSHSGELALIAVGADHPLGIDIEQIRSEVDTSALAERFFSPRERAALRALPGHLRLPGFFACWTRKEAVIKVTGAGLSFPLADFSVTTDPAAEPVLEELRGEEAPQPWFLADLDVADGYRATLAVRAPSVRVHTYAHGAT